VRSHSLHRNATGSVLALLGTLLLVKCSQSSAEGVCDPPCGIGQVCTAERRCETTSTGGTAGTAGAGLGGTSSGGTTSSGGSSGSVILTPPDAGPDSAEPADGDACADVTFEVTNVVPTVVLLVDRSASMSEEELDVANPGVSRWDALKTALLDPTGAIASLEQAVRFGIVFYAGGRNGQNACPVLDQGGEPPVLMPPRTGILTDFTTYFQPLDTLPDTPTGESVAFTAGELAAFTEPGPKFIVLATDGEPDLCDDRQEPSGRERSLAEVTAAHANDITTFVISVGTDVAETHLSELANAGQGFPPDDMPAAPRFYQVTTQQALADAFQQIITGTRSCTLTLNGEIDPDLADRGVVSIDGTPVPMSETDGWRIVDGSTIELVGAACQSIQSGEHTLSASFPCEVIVQPPR
jgi:uncharacterized protein YegL